MKIEVIANTNQMPKGKTFRLFCDATKQFQHVKSEIDFIAKREGLTFGTVYQFAGTYFYATIEKG